MVSEQRTAEISTMIASEKQIFNELGISHTDNLIPAEIMALKEKNISSVNFNLALAKNLKFPTSSYYRKIIKYP